MNFGKSGDDKTLKPYRLNSEYDNLPGNGSHKSAHRLGGSTVGTVILTMFTQPG